MDPFFQIICVSKKKTIPIDTPSVQQKRKLKKTSCWKFEDEIIFQWLFFRN